MASILIIIFFLLGYLAIALEGRLLVDKSATALLTAVVCWTTLAVGGILVGTGTIDSVITEHLGHTASIVFFLMGAMTIVELIDAHNGFDLITQYISTTKKSRLLIVFTLLAFFLSAILDNLTTTIVMISLLRKIIPNHKDQLLFGGMIVIAANAGGAFSPIGDVTTIMLWIGNRVTTANIILKLIVPSLVCIIIPLIAIASQLKGHLEKTAADVVAQKNDISKSKKRLMLLIGVGSLIFVPIFKTLTDLPPFLGILLGVGLTALVGELIHRQDDWEDKKEKTILGVLQRIDMGGILFFLGILLAVNALESAGTLTDMANWLDTNFSSIYVVNGAIGILSSIVDNVPLVAGMMGMYGLDQYATNHIFWELLSFCAGTGGSILIIGSAAGVAAMGLLKIDFIWYMKKFSLWALLGYFSGMIALWLIQIWF